MKKLTALLLFSIFMIGSSFADPDIGFYTPDKNGELEIKVESEKYKLSPLKEVAILSIGIAKIEKTFFLKFYVKINSKKYSELQNIPLVFWLGSKPASQIRFIKLSQGINQPKAIGQKDGSDFEVDIKMDTLEDALFAASQVIKMNKINDEGFFMLGFDGK